MARPKLTLPEPFTGKSLKPGISYKFRAYWKCERCGEKGSRVVKLVTFRKGGISEGLAVTGISCAVTLWSKGGWHFHKKYYRTHANPTDCSCGEKHLIVVHRISRGR